MKTTLNKIREHSPCASGWKKLLTYIGKTEADDEPLSILTILDSNGLHDALWCLRAVEGYDREIRLYAVWCARQVQHLLTDKRSLDALDVAERYANGEATDAELAAARDAGVAAWDAARVAGVAAWAAGEAAGEAAWSVCSASEAAGISRLEIKKKQEAELRRICGGGGEMKITPPFDRVEITIRGYNGKEIISNAYCWTKTELTSLHPNYLSQFVASKVQDMTQAMVSNHIKSGGERQEAELRRMCGEG